MGALLSPEILQAGAVKGLSTIERDHHIDRGSLRGRICARAEISPESIFLQD